MWCMRVCLAYTTAGQTTAVGDPGTEYRVECLGTHFTASFLLEGHRMTWACSLVSVASDLALVGTSQSALTTERRSESEVSVSRTNSLYPTIRAPRRS